MTVDELMNKLAGELPEGARIDLCVEKDAGWVEARDLDGNIMEFDNHSGIEEDVLAALEWCRQKEDGANA